jgi:hypothetical protein
MTYRLLRFNAQSLSSPLVGGERFVGVVGKVEIAPQEFSDVTRSLLEEFGYC